MQQKAQLILAKAQKKSIKGAGNTALPTDPQVRTKLSKDIEFSNNTSFIVAEMFCVKNKCRNHRIKFELLLRALFAELYECTNTKGAAALMLFEFMQAGIEKRIDLIGIYDSNGEHYFALLNKKSEEKVTPNVSFTEVVYVDTCYGSNNVVAFNGDKALTKEELRRLLPTCSIDTIKPVVTFKENFTYKNWKTLATFLQFAKENITLGMVSESILLYGRNINPNEEYQKIQEKMDEKIAWCNQLADNTLSSSGSLSSALGLFSSSSSASVTTSNIGLDDDEPKSVRFIYEDSSDAEEAVKFPTFHYS